MIQSVAGLWLPSRPPPHHAHPSCTLPNGRVMTAEFVNLTRDVRIGGTAPAAAMSSCLLGRADHSMWSSSTFPLAEKQFVLGRWGLHFHHAMDGAIGSLIEGVRCTTSACERCSPTPRTGRRGATAQSTTSPRATGSGGTSIARRTGASTRSGIDASSPRQGQRVLVRRRQRERGADCVAFGSFGNALTVAAFNWPSSLGLPADFKALGCIAHTPTRTTTGGRACASGRTPLHSCRDFISYRNVMPAFTEPTRTLRPGTADLRGETKPFEMHALGSLFNDCICTPTATIRDSDRQDVINAESLSRTARSWALPLPVSDHGEDTPTGCEW